VDQTNWPFVVSVSTDPALVETGFDENWNGKVEPQEPVVPSNTSSVGRVKSSYE
jgi:hypothetical protein